LTTYSIFRIFDSPREERTLLVKEDKVSSKTTIAIGPERDQPTWRWVGFDLGRELSKYFNMKFFEKRRIPPCDALILIKEPLPLCLFDRLNLDHVIYFPCDHYRRKEDIEKDRFLERCSCIVSHSKELADTLKRFNPNVFLINHNGKYVLPKMNDYKKDGFVLWIGFSIYIPYLRQWLLKHPLEKELVILTDWPNEERIPGNVTQLRWTPKLQFKLMSSAKAAMDIKGEDFYQWVKPPEKLQTFIASGIPSACNPGPIRAFLKSLGFGLCAPDETERWFSREYYDDTVQFGRRLREEMSLEKIGRDVKEIVDGTLAK